MNTSTGARNILANSVFLDTSFALASFSVTDHQHDRAIALAFALQKHNIRIITTHAVMCEIGNHFAKAVRKRYGLRVIDAYSSDPSITILNGRRALLRDMYYDAANRPIY